MRTIRNDLSVLSVAAEYAIEQEWAGTNPVTQLGKRALRYKKAVFVLPPPEDIETALASVSGPLEDLCRFLRHTGARRDEARDLHWNDVDIARRSATLRDTKNGTSRTIALNDEAVAIVNARPRSLLCPNVFTRLDGKPYGQVSPGWREGQYRAIKRAAETKGKYHRFRLHDLRHIYAIEYLRGGGNLYTLQKQLGHGSIRQTEEYLQFLTPEEQERVKSGAAQNPAQMHRFTVANGSGNG
jgi:integrase/recombinase XerD